MEDMQRVTARLEVLERLKTLDIHSAAWYGDAALVRAHIEFQIQQATLGARRSLRSVRDGLHDLESEFHEEESFGEAPAPAPVAMAYEEQITEARTALAKAEKRGQDLEASAAVATANLVDETDFGDGYRPLHYAAYAGHLDTVRVLLDFGADATMVNDAGCDALFLAAQQGHSEIVQLLLDSTDTLSTVDAGDGRSLCALDVARPDRKCPRRQATRDVLLEWWAQQQKSNDVAPPAPELRQGPDAGLEVRWNEDEMRNLTEECPSNHVKVKVMKENETAAVAVVVISTSAQKIRVRTVEPGSAYVAVIAGINALGATVYSAASNAVTAPPPPDGNPADVPASDEEERRVVDPKIARARQTVIDRRKKRHRVAALLKTEERHQRRSRHSSTGALLRDEHKSNPTTSTTPLDDDMDI